MATCQLQVVDIPDCSMVCELTIRLTIIDQSIDHNHKVNHLDQPLD